MTNETPVECISMRSFAEHMKAADLPPGEYAVSGGCSEPIVITQPGVHFYASTTRGLYVIVMPPDASKDSPDV